jgi:hypothetical protein
MRLAGDLDERLELSPARCRRDPGAGRRLAAVRPPGLHQLPDLDAHRRPDRGRDRRRPGAARLPGHPLVRDGYSGYEHLTGALHAWCGAHLLRDLKARHDAGPGGQARAAARRFQKYEDMILRFVTRPDLDIFTSNAAGRTIRCVKVQPDG